MSEEQQDGRDGDGGPGGGGGSAHFSRWRFGPEGPPEGDWPAVAAIGTLP